MHLFIKYTYYISEKLKVKANCLYGRNVYNITIISSQNNLSYSKIIILHSTNKKSYSIVFFLIRTRPTVSRLLK